MNRLRGGEITREKNWRAKKTNGALSSPVRPSARFFRVFFFCIIFPTAETPAGVLTQLESLPIPLCCC